MIELQELQKELINLPLQERLSLARWLIDSILHTTIPSEQGNEFANPLLKMAGRYTGGPGNSAERVEEILLAELAK